MFSGTSRRFCVTKVDVVDNGDFNIQYRETKRQFEVEEKPLDELFVFHGTTGKNSRYATCVWYLFAFLSGCMPIDCPCAASDT